MDQTKTPSIDGHMTILGPAHLIAIYERNGEHYVAEFHGSRGELTRASSWYRLNAAALRRRQAAFSRPLDRAALRSIERLHAQAEARQERMLAVPRRLAAAVRDYVAGVLSRLQGRASVEKLRVHR